MAALRLTLVTGLGSRGQILRPYVIGSLLAHALAGVAFLALPSLRGGSRIPESAFTVELAALPAPRPPAPAAAPPSPTPAPPREAPEGVRMETKKVVETKRPPKKPEPEPEPQQPAPPRAEPAEPPAEAGGGAIEDAGLTVEAGATIGGQLGDSAMGWYRTAVFAALYGNWRRPVVSGLREPLEVTVGFDILRDGTVQGLRIDRESGVPALDRSALRAVSEASPLPPLPRSWSEARLAARIVFQLNPEE